MIQYIGNLIAEETGTVNGCTVDHRWYEFAKVRQYWDRKYYPIEDEL